MTVEKPKDLAEVWFGNGTDAPVDVYVNGASEPELSDLKALELGPVFTVDGSPTRPFQVYRFEVREKEQPMSETLAIASIALEKGESYTAVYHKPEGSDGQLSIFANDFTGAAETRLEIRHVGVPAAISWALAPSPNADPAIPEDIREGMLRAGQWQSATEVIENTYVLEAMVDGLVVGRDPDLELEKNKMLAVYLVGNPRPTLDAKDLKKAWLVQEFQISTRDRTEATVTEPTDPVSKSENDARISFELTDAEVWETNAIEIEIKATDPDGIVAGLTLSRVDPDQGSIEIPDGGVQPSTTAGDPATGMVRVGADTPPGDYMVRVIANPDSIAASPFGILKVQVKPITVDRLKNVLDQQIAAQAIDTELGRDLDGLLGDAASSIGQGALADGCSTLSNFVTRLSDAEGNGATSAGVASLTRETDALRTRLACG